MDTALIHLLRALERGELSAEDAAGRVRQLAESDLGFAVVDHDRAARTGAPEVVYGAGKTPEQIAALLERIASRGQAALATRVDAEKAAAIQERVDATYEPVPRLLWHNPADWRPPARSGLIGVVCAGTSDLPVAEEAARTAEWFGWPVRRITDVGVAGLHRLLSRLDALREADVLIVVAGMEGALPSVVAGLVHQPVVAVPTSVGYGANLGGLTALLAMLNACASGVAVVNIDNGFGAAQVAHRILTGRER